MPKQTFLNLAEAKRKAFVDAAVEEFAANDYESASISHVVAQLGIAKGSLYQYFDDKRDLYLYLVERAAQERIAFVQSQQPPDPQLSFYAYTQWLLEMGVRFTLEYPRLNQILYRAMFGAVPFRDEMLQRMQASSLELIRQVLAQGIAAGEVEPDLDLDLVAYLLNLITNDFSHFLVSRLRIDPQRLMAGDYAQLDMEALHGVFAQAMDFMWHGLAKRPTIHSAIT